MARRVSIVTTKKNLNFKNIESVINRYTKKKKKKWTDPKNVMDKYTFVCICKGVDVM